MELLVSNVYIAISSNHLLLTSSVTLQYKYGTYMDFFILTLQFESEANKSQNLKIMKPNDFLHEFYSLNLPSYSSSKSSSSDSEIWTDTSVSSSSLFHSKNNPNAMS